MKTAYLSHWRLTRSLAACLLLIPGMLAFPYAVSAGVWQVTPIRLDFDGKARSGVITVRNDGEEKLVLTVDAREWTQPEEGKDVYSSTDDLLFFPKKLTVLPKEERVIRVGTKVAAGTKEKTYRLYIKEEPEAPGKKTTGAAQVSIAMQFAVPVFVKPPRDEVRGEMRGTRLENGEARAVLANKGNVHFRVNTVRFVGKNAAGETIFSQEVNGWYLLSGAARLYATPVPADKCSALHVIDVQVDADLTKLNGKIDVDKNACRRNH